MKIVPIKPAISKYFHHVASYVSIATRSKRAYAGLAILTLGILLIVNVSPDLPGEPAPGTVAAEQYKTTLQSQVDKGGGEPRDGRDPSVQKQTSLSQSASTPQGNGTRTDKPAAGVTYSNQRPATPADVYGDPAKTGISAGGCYIDYGIPGQQCLPSGIAGADGVPDCREVRTKFANGITVSGKDRFSLDSNNDGLACGTGE